MITLTNVSKSFEGHGAEQVHAVKQVSLQIEKGQIFGVIGFSGAGKSTLIRCINLLERPTAGNVVVDGVDLTTLSAKELRTTRKNIGMIFQHFNLFASRTVGQNVELPLKKSGLSKVMRKQKVKDLLALVDLTDKEHSYPSQLSGGQKQRVAIARALANNPKILLCDEATSALDPQTTKSILALLQKLNRELGLTIVLITHEMAVVKEICDGLALMEDGEVVESGDIQTIFSAPKTPTAKRFVETSEGVSKIYDMIDSGHPLTQLQEGEQLVLLTYTDEHAGLPLISRLVQQYGIEANIIYGNIELLKDQPLGKLVLKLSGHPEKIAAAIGAVQTAQITLEVLKR